MRHFHHNIVTAPTVMSLARRSPFKQFEGLTMHVFLTGATGFIGSMIVRELIGAGHQVTGLTRSAEGARQLDSFRARAHRGTIEDPAIGRAAWREREGQYGKT